MQIEAFNELPVAEASTLMRDCCAAPRWVSQVVAGRPYAQVDDLLDTAADIWSQMDEPDFLAAFDAHPKIGDPASLKKKYASTHALASNEQSAVQHATDVVINSLATENERYLQKFGFIFIVCATGKSAAEMLDLVRLRMPNERSEELLNAASEQGAITAIRINKLFAPAD
ncbi:MAG: 2-oxo-4-hydroxy-4-carboxy-5-ureidoimidazoline decarboxylase [Gammaproteobacteria bacterium]|nr:2-oxo-4-hydroxy-4-carboxy-5-ureidoimidazoline decarboxylase [Gammaproteobacteria bacterium]